MMTWRDYVLAVVNFIVIWFIGIALILTVGCGRSELPDGVRINSDDFMAPLMAFYGKHNTPWPVVLGVRPTCDNNKDGELDGFWEPLIGICIAGFAEPDNHEIYLVIHRDAPYSYTLPHELIHIFYPDDWTHRDPALWGPGGKVENGRAFMLKNYTTEQLVVREEP
jgi:hypothetical protein